MASRSSTAGGRSGLNSTGSRLGRGTHRRLSGLDQTVRTDRECCCAERGDGNMGSLRGLASTVDCITHPSETHACSLSSLLVHGTLPATSLFVLTPLNSQATLCTWSEKCGSLVFVQKIRKNSYALVLFVVYTRALRFSFLRECRRLRRPTLILACIRSGKQAMRVRWRNQRDPCWAPRPRSRLAEPLLVMFCPSRAIQMPHPAAHTTSNVPKGERMENKNTRWYLCEYS